MKNVNNRKPTIADDCTAEEPKLTTKEKIKYAVIFFLILAFAAFGESIINLLFNF